MSKVSSWVIAIAASPTCAQRLLAELQSNTCSPSDSSQCNVSCVNHERSELQVMDPRAEPVVPIETSRWPSQQLRNRCREKEFRCETGSFRSRAPDAIVTVTGVTGSFRSGAPDDIVNVTGVTGSFRSGAPDAVGPDCDCDWCDWFLQIVTGVTGSFRSGAPDDVGPELLTLWSPDWDCDWCDWFLQVRSS
ncbi:unnamed protein product [Pleuronectes platessa]|uniref:Uncharacterized protein n=1 Tax=Pleuronectes platessa TaxID=8262 RepID=A0A9N7TTS7_PLEPL|nr:unnamed protein product [Pleuronectes platessa]